MTSSTNNVFPLGAHGQGFTPGGNGAGPPPAAPAPRPPGRYLMDTGPDSVRWLHEELGRNGLSRYFRRGPSLVVCNRIDEDGYQAPEGTDDDNGPATVALADGLHVQGSLALDYRLTRWVGTGGNRREVERMFPLPLANAVVKQLDRAEHLRELRSVTHTPIVRADGTILSAAGYDDASGVLHLPELDVPAVPEFPTQDDVDDAVGLLRFMVAEFPWLGPHDEANYLGALLTPLLRLIAPPPYKMLAIGARQPGSGKSLLGKVLRAVHGGVLRTSWPRDDAELDKSLVSILTVTTAPIVEFDNVSGLLSSPRMDSLLTQAEYSDRLLGSTNQPTLINDRLWVVTGNNVKLGSDLTRRTMWCTIDPGVPNPELLTHFTIKSLERWARERRGLILWALLTLIRAWVVADRPMPPQRSSDDYAHWRAVVGGILAHAGVPGEFDAAESAQQEQGAQDDGWSQLFEVLHTLWGSRLWKSSDVAALLFNPQPCIDAGLPTLAEVLPEPLAEKHERGRPITQSLGKFLEAREGRWSGKSPSYTVRRSKINAAGRVAQWSIDTL